MYVGGVPFLLAVGARHGREAVVAGVAKLDDNRLPGRTERSIHAEVGNLALVDAGLTWGDVDSFATAGNLNLYGFNLMEYLGIHPDWYDDTNVGGCSFEILVEHAAHAVESS
jgi:hypothetical protein